jgi:hypothetical protein
MKLKGDAVNFMLQLEKYYSKFVTNENGKQTFYLQLKKALYCCVNSALLWYEVFSGTLQGMGFKLNPYNA